MCIKIKQVSIVHSYQFRSSLLTHPPTPCHPTMVHSRTRDYHWLHITHSYSYSSPLHYPSHPRSNYLSHPTPSSHTSPSLADCYTASNLELSHFPPIGHAPSLHQSVRVIMLALLVIFSTYVCTCDRSQFLNNARIYIQSFYENL